MGIDDAGMSNSRLDQGRVGGLGVIGTGVGFRTQVGGGHLADEAIDLFDLFAGKIPRADFNPFGVIQFE